MLTQDTVEFLGWGISARRFSGVREPNFTKLFKDTVRSGLHRKFASEFGYLAAFSNTGGSKLSDVENNAKFCTF